VVEKIGGLYKGVPMAVLKGIAAGDFFDGHEIVGIEKRRYGFTMVMRNGAEFNAHRKCGTFTVHVFSRELVAARKELSHMRR
jgi:hypothetical protein